MFQAWFYIIIKLNPQLNGWDVMTSAQGKNKYKLGGQKLWSTKMYWHFCQQIKNKN